MATHKSAEKRHRQSVKRRARNRSVKSAVSTALKRASEAMAASSASASSQAATSGSAETMGDLVRRASSLLAKAAARGVIHKKNAQRRISRLNKKLASGKLAS